MEMSPELLPIGCEDNPRAAAPHGLVNPRSTSRARQRNPLLTETIAAYDALPVEYAARFAAVDFATARRQFENGVQRVGSEILDAGCGSGRDLALFAGRGFAPTGIDLSVGLLQQARQASQASLVLGDLCELPFSSESFSGVWCCAVLLHLSPCLVRASLREVFRVLVQGGAVFVSTRHGQGEGWRAWGDQHRRWFHFYSLEEVVEMMETSGLVVASAAVEDGVATGNGHWVNVHASRP
jgi:SAM-dependent methyltransferase